MVNMKRHPPIARTQGNAQHWSVVSLRPSQNKVRWAWLMGLVFLVILAADWGLNIFLFSKVRNYAIPVLSIFFPLVCIAGLAGHGQMQSVYKQNAIAKFSFYVLWFVFAILLELALSSGPYSVPLEDQWRVYWSFGQVIFWAFAGYQFVQRREDAAWLLHRFAVGMACICALSYLLKWRLSRKQKPGVLRTRPRPHRAPQSASRIGVHRASSYSVIVGSSPGH